MRKFSCFEQATFLYQFQPVWDVVVYRALPLAIRITARQAAPRLRCCTGTVIVTVYLAEMLHALGLDPLEQAMNVSNLPPSDRPGPGRLPDSDMPEPDEFDRDWQRHTQPAE